jgi:hypothetical protein
VTGKEKAEERKRKRKEKRKKKILQEIEKCSSIKNRRIYVYNQRT